MCWTQIIPKLSHIKSRISRHPLAWCSEPLAPAAPSTTSPWLSLSLQESLFSYLYLLTLYPLSRTQSKSHLLLKISLVLTENVFDSHKIKFLWFCPLPEFLVQTRKSSTYPMSPCVCNNCFRLWDLTEGQVLLLLYKPDGLFFKVYFID